MVITLVNILKAFELYNLNRWNFAIHELYLNKVVIKKERTGRHAQSLQRRE